MILYDLIHYLNLFCNLLDISLFWLVFFGKKLKEIDIIKLLMIVKYLYIVLKLLKTTFQ